MDETPNVVEEKKGRLGFLSSWIKDDYDKYFVYILLAAFAIRILIFVKTLNQPLWWDGADYMSAAKRLGLGLNIQDIWYYRRGFLFPLISAPFFALGFGETGVRLLEVFFSTGFIFVSYLFMTRFVEKKIALLASICLSFSWLMIFFSGRILTDIPAAFFILLSFLLFWDGYYLDRGKKYLYFAAAVFVLAVLTRMQSLMVAPAFLLIAIMKEKTKFVFNKKIWIAFLIFVALMIPQFYLYSSHYGNPFADISSHYLGIGEEAEQSGNARTFNPAMFNYVFDIPYIVGDWIFYLFFLGLFIFFLDLILGFDKIFKNVELQKKFFIFSFAAIIFLVMGYVGSVSYVEQRYVTPALPFLFLIAVFPLVKLQEYLEKNNGLSKRLSGIVIVAILLLLLIPNFSLGKDMIEEKKTSYFEVKEAGLWIKENSNPEDKVVTNSVPQITYYSERSTYPYDPGFYYGTKLGNPEFLKYSDDKEGFLQFVEDYKPRFMILSLYESIPQWAQTFPQDHPEKVVPVKIYPENTSSPVLIIYEFKY